MSTAAFFFVEKQNYSFDRFLGSLVVAAFRANVRIWISRYKKYDKEGDMRYFDINICYRPQHDSQMLMYVNSEKHAKQSLDSCASTLERHIRSKSHLEYYEAGYIEDISGLFETRERLLFDFVYEYLRLNPHDLLWVDDDLVFGLEELERLRRRPYCRTWCYQDPNTE